MIFTITNRHKSTSPFFKVAKRQFLNYKIYQNHFIFIEYISIKDVLFYRIYSIKDVLTPNNVDKKKTSTKKY